MNPHDHAVDDWQQISTDWQQLAVPECDIAALQSEAERRSRRVRLLALAELLIAIVALGNCVRALLDPRKAIAPGLLCALMAIVVCTAVWLFRQRRSQLRSHRLAPGALVAFEIARARTSLRIWRVSIWGSLVLWMGLVLLALVAMRAGPQVAGALPPSAWALNIGLNALVVLVSAGLGAWSGRQRRRQLARLHALREALDAS